MHLQLNHISNQSYKKVVQLALRAKKLANERLNRGKFQKMRSFGFLSGQSTKKSKSFESLEHSSRSCTESVSSPQVFSAVAGDGTIATILGVINLDYLNLVFII